jgi:hypothetical protein
MVWYNTIQWTPLIDETHIYTDLHQRRHLCICIVLMYRIIDETHIYTDLHQRCGCSHVGEDINTAGLNICKQQDRAAG